MRTLVLVLLSAAAASPQALSVGVKGGVPLGDAFKIASNVSAGRSYFQNTKRYTFGPMVDVRLPFGLGIEFDALYKRLEYGSTAGVISSLTKGQSWEFPLIAKYRGPSPVVHPYAGAGVSFRSLRGLKQFVTTPLQTSLSDKPSELNESFNKGVVLAGGLEVKALVVRISPELRYTRWVEHGFRDALKLFGSNRNQIEILIGLTF
ncbi:MAG: outer membrane beta-barrel protein [Acidobacteria bacterium]|nr:outer membrane beta-barrel protein [Acidobacteriota bacterium]